MKSLVLHLHIQSHLPRQEDSRERSGSWFREWVCSAHSPLPCCSTPAVRKCYNGSVCQALVFGQSEPLTLSLVQTRVSLVDVVKSWLVQIYIVLSLFPTRRSTSVLWKHNLTSMLHQSPWRKMLDFRFQATDPLHWFTGINIKKWFHLDAWLMFKVVVLTWNCPGGFLST